MYRNSQSASDWLFLGDGAGRSDIIFWGDAACGY